MSSSRHYPTDPDAITVYLGQFTREHADEIAGRLEGAGITWWYKEPGVISRIWEYGVRVFVDRERIEEARGIAAQVLREPGDG